MWYWCLHCERAQRQDIEPNDSLAETIQCRFSDCNGRLWPYVETLSRFSEIVSGWPEVPEEGKVYPLFSPYYKAFQGSKVVLNDSVAAYLENLRKC